MLRKLIIIVVVVNFMFMLAGVLTTFDQGNRGIAVADNVANFGVGVNVPSFLEINADLYELDEEGLIDWESNPGSLNFGSLVEVRNETTVWFMAGENAYAVVMFPVSSGRGYEITQTGTALTNGGGDAIPEGAYVMNPSYQYEDELGEEPQGAMPGGAFCSPPVSAVGNANPVYTSDGDGTAKAIRTFLSITGPDENEEIKNYAGGYNGDQGVGDEQFYYDPANPNASDWEPVTQSQPGGEYSGSVTYTLNLQG